MRSLRPKLSFLTSRVLRQLERATQLSNMASTYQQSQSIEDGLTNCVMSVQGKQCWYTLETTQSVAQASSTTRDWTATLRGYWAGSLV